MIYIERNNKLSCCKFVVKEIEPSGQAERCHLEKWDSETPKKEAKKICANCYSFSPAWEVIEL